jgi:hypothetical protein
MDQLLAHPIGRWPLIAALAAASLATNLPRGAFIIAAQAHEIAAPADAKPEGKDCATGIRKTPDNRSAESAAPQACQTTPDDWALALRLAIIKSITAHPFGFFR